MYDECIRFSFSFIFCIEPRIKTDQTFTLYITGDAMPQDHINFKGRRRGTCHNTCKANGEISGTDLVNGPTAPNGCKAYATTTSESTPAVTLNGTKPQCMVNGYINHGCKGKSTKTQRKEGRRISAVIDASAAGSVSGGGIPGGISVSGVTSLDVDASAHNSDQMTPDHSLSASMKNRRRKKFRRKKRYVNNLTAAPNKSFSVKCSSIHNYSKLSVQSSLSD